MKKYISEILFLLFAVCFLFDVKTEAESLEYIEEECAHPYSNNCDKNYFIAFPDAENIELFFSEDTELENGFDFLYIYDSNGEFLSKYTGTELAGERISIKGNACRIRLKTNDNTTKYGFHVTANAYAATTAGELGDNLKWSLVENTLTITGVGAMEEHYGFSFYEDVFTTYYPWSKYLDEINTVIIGEGITTIAPYSFVGCRNLSEIHLANSVERIESFAFGYCGKLEELIIPEQVSFFAEDAIMECTALRNITVSDNNRALTSFDGVLFTKDMRKLLRFPCSKSGSYSIPESVQTICRNGFHDCDKLTDIYIPETVIELMDYAFAGCDGICTVVVPRSVERIGNNAFENCKKLEKCFLGEGVKAIQSSSFSGCISLQFIDIPDTVEAIGFQAFSGCYSLVNIKLPDNLCQISVGCFMDCSSLEKIEIPDNVTAIEACAFWGCGNLKYIDIPGSVSRIERDAFTYCRKLTGVVIPDSVAYLGAYAFDGCSDLQSVYLNYNNKMIREGVFSGCNSLQTVVYDGSSEQWGKMQIDINNSALTHAKIICLNDKSTPFVFPMSTKVLRESAFEGCSNIGRIVFMSEVSLIEANAFLGCENLREIWFTGSTVELSVNAFAGVTADVLYPIEVASTWKEQIGNSYGGNICWYPVAMPKGCF